MDLDRQREKSSKKCRVITVVMAVACACSVVVAGVFLWMLIDKNGMVNDLENSVAKLTDEVNELKAGDVPQAPMDTNNVGEGLEAELRAALKAAGRKAPTENEVEPGESWLTISVGYEKLENSSVVPWQILSVGVGDSQGGGAVGNFYRKGADYKWKFGFMAQNTPSCSDSMFKDNSDLREAFADLSCYEDGKLTTVKDSQVWKSFFDSSRTKC